jgi:ubiquinone/menaquinone biosynthesis C-methylase UbiE
MWADLDLQEEKERRAWIALMNRVAGSAFGDEGEYVGQESFVTGTGILALAQAAGLKKEMQVADLCCGTGGPGLYIASRLGCRLTGVDIAAGAVKIAQGRMPQLGLSGRVQFIVGDATKSPLPGASFDAVMMLETFLGIRDKMALFQEAARLLRPGGYFFFTMEDGPPLSAEEKILMPGSDTVRIISEQSCRSMLEQAGLQVTACWEMTQSHAAVAERLADAFTKNGELIASIMGPAFSNAMIHAHRLWAKWYNTGPLRSLAMVAQQRHSG